MHRDTAGSTSRRAFVKYGLLSTGALIGASSAGAADPETDSAGAAGGAIERGVMRSYQYTPDSRATVRSAVDWRPQGLEDAAGAYVVSYDAAPSYEALLVTTGEPDADRLRPGDAVSIGSVRGSPSEASRRYVTVDLAAADG